MSGKNLQCAPFFRTPIWKRMLASFLQYEQEIQIRRKVKWSLLFQQTSSAQPLVGYRCCHQPQNTKSQLPRFKDACHRLNAWMLPSSGEFYDVQNPRMGEKFFGINLTKSGWAFQQVEERQQMWLYLQVLWKVSDDWECTIYKTYGPLYLSLSCNLARTSRDNLYACEITRPDRL